MPPNTYKCWDTFCVNTHFKKTTILQLQLSNNHSSKEIHEYLGNLRVVLICPVHFNCLSNHIPGTRNTLVLHTHSPTGLLRFLRYKVSCNTNSLNVHAFKLSHFSKLILLINNCFYEQKFHPNNTTFTSNFFYRCC